MQKKPVKKVFINRRAIAKKGEKFTFDYKNVALLQRFMGESGTILPRENTGLTNKKQRELAQEIKRARHVALLPFVTTL
jgi:small subunit ribosomal protein S18